MRICILSDYNGFLDEGMRNIAYHFSSELSKKNDIMHQCLLPRKNLISFSFWREIENFDPEIIHFIPGSTLKTFIFVRLLRSRFPRAKIIMSVPHAVLNLVTERIVPFFQPDLILTQSYESDRILKKSGMNTIFFPNGVDVNKFVPPSMEYKQQVRTRYGIDKSTFIILHVGHLTKERNLKSLIPLQKINNVQVLIVASISAGCNDRDLQKTLIDAGCLIWHKYFENIYEVYAMADGYIFPTTDKKGCVEFPLSILEAMSCNLPVVSTEFSDVLNKTFIKTEGLMIVQREEEIVPVIQQMVENEGTVKTRDAVLPYSWENLACKLESIYLGVLAHE